MDGEILDGRWYIHLRAARSDQDVLVCVREFLDSLSPREASRLSTPAPEVDRVEQIPMLSVRLAAAYESLSDPSPDRPLFMRAIALLCYATDRLSQVPAARGRRHPATT
jgi:hypothetical protein